MHLPKIKRIIHHTCFIFRQNDKKVCFLMKDKNMENIHCIGSNFSFKQYIQLADDGEQKCKRSYQNC